MSQLKNQNIFFLNHRSINVKVRLDQVGSKTDFFTILSQKFPHKQFPIDTTFYAERAKKDVADLSQVTAGEIVRVVPPSFKAKPAEKRPLLCVTQFDDDATIEGLKRLLGLDESLNEKNFFFTESFMDNGYMRLVFIELGDDFQIARVVKADGLLLASGKRLSVFVPEEKIRELYVREKRRYKVVEVKKFPTRATSADLRIFFAIIPIFSVHLVKNGLAFLEISEEDLFFALKFDGEKMLDNKITVKESTQTELVEAISKSRSDEKLPADFSEMFPPIPNVAPHPLVRQREEAGLESPVYENKDFKCVLMSNMPVGASDLDIARFFDDAKIQPILMHLRKDGTAAYCEFSSVKETDKAIDMNQQQIKNNDIEIKRVRYSEISALKNKENSDFIIDTKDLDHYRVPIAAGARGSPAGFSKSPKAESLTTEEIAQITAGAAGVKKKKKKKAVAKRFINRFDNADAGDDYNSAGHSQANADLGVLGSRHAEYTSTDGAALATRSHSRQAVFVNNHAQRKQRAFGSNKRSRMAPMGYGQASGPSASAPHGTMSHGPQSYTQSPSSMVNLAQSQSNSSHWGYQTAEKAASLSDLLSANEAIINNIGSAGIPDYNQQYYAAAAAQMQPYGTYQATPANYFAATAVPAYQRIQPQRRYFEADSQQGLQSSQHYNYPQANSGSSNPSQVKYSGQPMMSGSANIHTNSQLD